MVQDIILSDSRPKCFEKRQDRSWPVVMRPDQDHPGRNASHTLERKVSAVGHDNALLQDRELPEGGIA